MKQPVTFNLECAGNIEVTDEQGNYVTTLDLAHFTMSIETAEALLAKLPEAIAIAKAESK